MTDIYQKIWDADQKYAGLKAIKVTDEVTKELEDQGYIIVNKDATASKEHKLIQKIHLPEYKKASYDLARKIFNNYTLDQTKEEHNLPEESAEVQEFINAIYKCEPMNVARDFVETASNSKISDDQWWSIIQRVWFEQFTDGNNKDLSGFEHIVVGEQKQGKVNGYHCWYKYYLDENFRKMDSDDQVTDLLNFISWVGPTEVSPEVATLSYEWRAFDYEKEEFRKLFKKIGGFWIGPSIPGLLALGLVCFLPEAAAPMTTEVNGVKYHLRKYASPSKRQLRTFFPEYIEENKERTWAHRSPFKPIG